MDKNNIYQKMLDVTKLVTSEIPKNPDQNVDAGSKNDDLSTKVKRESDKTPKNPGFNKKVSNGDLANKTETESSVPTNKNFNVPDMKKLADISNSVKSDSKVPDNKNFNKNGQSVNKRLDNSFDSRLVNMEPTDVVLVKKPVIESTQSSKYKYVPTINDIYEKVYFEAANVDPNMFSLDLGNMYMDKVSMKFSVNIQNQNVIVEIQYPNADGKVSVRLETDKQESVESMSVDSDEFVNLVNYIQTKGNELIQQQSNVIDKGFGDLEPYVGSGYNDEEMAYGNVPGNDLKGGVFTSFKGNLLDSVQKPKSFRQLMEAEDDEEDAPVDEGDAPADDAADAGDVNATDDEGGDLDLGGDEGAAGGGGGDLDFGGGFGDLFGGGGDDLGGADFGVDSEPEESPGISADAEVETMTFDEKESWSNAALNAMQSLVADFEAERERKGGGVIRSKDEIVNGMAGIKGQTNRQILESFKKVYQEVNDLEMTEEEWDDLEKELEVNPDSFDSFLAGLVGQKTGTEVDPIGALNNDMFDEFPEEEMPDEQVEEEGFGMEDFDETFSPELEGGLDFNEIEPEGEETEEEPVAEGEEEDLEFPEF